ncbi:MAG: hypothetical protein KGV57_01440 [Fusobacterium sp.]|nr:hypothetical protein [Fusobacterium sp.]
MKKIIYSLFTLVVLFSCSKNNDEPKFKDNLEKTDFEIIFKQSGDTEKLNLDSLIFVSDSQANFYEKNSNKNLGFAPSIDLENRKGTFKYYINKTKIIAVSSLIEIDREYENDSTVKVNISLIVKREGKEIFKESYTLDKSHRKGNFQFSFTKKNPK